MATATVVKERPILFSGEMVRAILDGRKTQTRRLVKGPIKFTPQKAVVCPYGQVGDRLWVRETFLVRGRGSHVIYRASLNNVEAAGIGAMYGGWKPSIFMPRWGCRLELEIVSHRVRLLNGIDEHDAECEGLYRGAARRHLWWRSPGHCRLVEPYRDHKRAFADLWDEINFKRAPWSSNPAVWRIEFRVVDSSRPTEAESPV